MLYLRNLDIQYLFKSSATKLKKLSKLTVVAIITEVQISITAKSNTCNLLRLLHMGLQFLPFQLDTDHLQRDHHTILPNLHMAHQSHLITLHHQPMELQVSPHIILQNLVMAHLSQVIIPLNLAMVLQSLLIMHRNPLTISCPRLQVMMLPSLLMMLPSHLMMLRLPSTVLQVNHPIMLLNPLTVHQSPLITDQSHPMIRQFPVMEHQ